jgi:hypothetical protein
MKKLDKSSTPSKHQQEAWGHYPENDVQEKIKSLITHQPSRGYRWLKNKILTLKRELKYRKRLKELKKKDPFIYK